MLVQMETLLVLTVFPKERTAYPRAGLGKELQKGRFNVVVRQQKRPFWCR